MKSTSRVRSIARQRSAVEDEGTVEHTEKNKLFFPVISGYLPAEFLHPLVDSRFVEDNARLGYCLQAHRVTMQAGAEIL